MQRINTIEQAIEALAGGNEEGLNVLFHEYYSSLSYFAFTILSDRQKAEEIASTAFLKLWENRESIEVATVKSWLYRVVKNASIDQLRKDKTLLKNQSLLSAEEDHVEPVIDKIIETETIRHVLVALSYLPPKCSEVFRLFYLQEKSHSEIAAMMNISEHTVRNQRLRAIRLLRAKL